jgi:fucose permease
MQVHWPETALAPSSGFGSPGARRALLGFFISGVLVSFLGAILPSWEHHLSSEYGVISLYFLGLITGLISSVWISFRLLASRGLGWTLSLACGLAGAAFLYLAFVSPPFSYWWRVGGMVLVGCSAGILHTAIFHAVSPMYRHDPIATVNLAGVFFGLGCFLLALAISFGYSVYTAPTIQTWIAVVPALFGWMYRKTRFEALPEVPRPPAGALHAMRRNPGAVLLSLLLFFQLGNEWAMAGWLALFLSQRLGISPATALWILALYWLALLVGRVAAQWLLSRMRHGRLWLSSVVAAMFGCVILSFTNNVFGAVTGVLLVGLAFAPIYPLVVEKIGRRFPYYHPGFNNGIFSVALAAGLLAPCVIGLAAAAWGLWIVMLFPLAGSAVVFLLLALIWLEARLSAHARPIEAQ